MRKALLSLLVAALGVLPSLAFALAVPAGKAGVIEAVVGKVDISVANATKAAKVGQALDFGATIMTGINGRLSLRHADNAVTRLAPNTELTLRAPGAKKGVFLGLTKGFIRFLVGKRAPGESFEVQTPNAVAAVKGTDAGVETDGKTTQSSVYESERPKAMDFISEKFGKTMTLSPGQTITLDEKGFTVRDLTDNERGAINDMFKSLPKPVVQEPTEGAKEGQDESGQGGEGGEAADVEEAQADIRDEINDAVADVMDDLQLDNFLERDDRTGDLVAGRIVFDRNGDRTQVSSYITRPDVSSVFKANYSKRLSGPFTGTSFAEELTVWNRPLVGDWNAIANMALDDAANLDGSGYPVYFRTYQNFLAGNPQGDTLQIETTYDLPMFSANYTGQGMSGYEAGPIYADQGLSRTLYTNNVNIFTVSVDIYTQYDDFGTELAEYSDLSGYWNTTTYATPDGGAAIDLDDGYGYPYLGAEFRVLDNAGSMYDLTDYANSNTLLYQDFKGLDSSLNLEVTFTAPNFVAPIDLIFIPELFASMDMLGLPTTSWYGCGMC